jgi:YfiH family protein
MILPPPGESFQWRDTTFGPALVCTPLETIAPHLFTTRAWTLGRSSGPHHAGWEEIAASFDGGRHPLVRLRQVHGRGVVSAEMVPRDPDILPQGDIIVSSGEAEAVIAVQAADCVPILIADRRRGHVSAAHAGWRGLAAGVPMAAVDALGRDFGSRPDDLIAVVGPAISSCCYEVGEDVRQAFVAGGCAVDNLDRWFHGAPTPDSVNRSMAGLPSVPRPDHWYFDGWQSAIDQLRDAGVPDSGIFSARLCTASHPDLFPSFRRDGSAAGRLAAAIRGRQGGPLTD